MTDTDAPPPDWYERGKQHFEQCQRTKGSAKVDYPTQDTHSPQDEADFARGFEDARRADLGSRLSPGEAD